MSKLGGELVGYGIRRVDGHVDYTWLDEPVHNRIVKTGIEHLLCFAGSIEANAYEDITTLQYRAVIFPNDIVGRYKTSKGYFHEGPLVYCAYGNGTKETSFYDTKLQNQLQITDKKYTGIPYCGSMFDMSDGNYSKTSYHRISHEFPQVSTKTEISELGWFGKIGQPNSSSGTIEYSYIMFSRIKLPNKLILEQGEILITTYQLDITEQLTSKIPGYLINSTKNEIDCYLLRASKLGTNSNWGDILNTPCISTNGEVYSDDDIKIMLQKLVSGTSTSSDLTYNDCYKYPIWYRKTKSTKSLLFSQADLSHPINYNNMIGGITSTSYSSFGEFNSTNFLKNNFYRYKKSTNVISYFRNTNLDYYAIIESLIINVPGLNNTPNRTAWSFPSGTILQQRYSTEDTEKLSNGETVY